MKNPGALSLSRNALDGRTLRPPHTRIPGKPDWRASRIDSKLLGRRRAACILSAYGPQTTGNFARPPHPRDRAVDSLEPAFARNAAPGYNAGTPDRAAVRTRTVGRRQRHWAESCSQRRPAAAAAGLRSADHARRLDPETHDRRLHRPAAPACAAVRRDRTAGWSG